MTDREERQHVIEVLEHMLEWMKAANTVLSKPERIKALDYAIASIKTDLKYDLLYEGVDCNNCKNNWHRGDGSTYCATGDGICHYEYEEPTTKNDVPDINVGKIGSTTKDYLGVDYLGVDAVSREAVTELVSSQRLDTFSDEGRKWANVKIDVILRGLKELPSVTPIRPKGHWIKVIGKTGHLVCECDKCEWQQKLYTNFCPSCGADMREVEE